MISLLLMLLSWSDIVARLDRGASTGDAAVLEAAAIDAEKLADTTGDARERQVALLGAAYAGWRLASLPGVEAAESGLALKRADDLLETAIKADGKYAEAYALLSSVLGLKIRAGGNAMELGPASQEARDTAVRLQPENPRVLLQAGTSAFHTPAEYGGGLDVAEPLLRHALAAFDREPPNRPWPNWGRFDAHAWLGQVLAAKGDKAGARQEYQAALAAQPQSEWVKRVLLPALDK